MINNYCSWKLFGLWCCQVQKLQEGSTKSSQDFIQLESEKSEYSRQVTELKNTIDTVRENNERQVRMWLGWLGMSQLLDSIGFYNRFAFKQPQTLYLWFLWQFQNRVSVIFYIELIYPLEPLVSSGFLHFKWNQNSHFCWSLNPLALM